MTLPIPYGWKKMWKGKPKHIRDFIKNNCMKDCPEQCPITWVEYYEKGGIKKCEKYWKY